MEAQHAGILGNSFFFCTGNNVLKLYPPPPKKNYPDWGSLRFSFVHPVKYPNRTWDEANTVSYTFSPVYIMNVVGSL